LTSSVATASIFRRNIVANYGGRIWNLLMALAVVPWQISFLGTEAYGLLGIYASLLSLTIMLDVGLSATTNREISRLSVGSNSAQEINDVGNTMGWLYWGLAGFIGAGIALAASPIANHWLQAGALGPSTIQHAIILMGVVLGLQWPVNFYVGCLSGLQRLVLVNAINILFATLRGVGGIAALWLIAPRIEVFFLSQAAVAALQVGAFVIAYRRAMPASDRRPVFRAAIVRRMAGFSAGVWGTYILAVPLSYTDRIILSKVLPLSAFGYYTLAASVAGGVGILSAPMFGAVFPRFSRLSAAGDIAEVSRLYHSCSQIVAIGVLSLAVALALFPREALFAWVGRPDVVAGASLPLSILVIGFALNGLMQVPYALQLAYGWSSLGVWVNFTSVVVLVPLTIILTLRWGAAGAAFAWMVLNMGYVLVAVPVMHCRLLKGEFRRWLWHDTALPLAVALIVGLVWRAVFPETQSRVILLLLLCCAGMTILAATAMTSPVIRDFLMSRARNAKGASKR